MQKADVMNIKGIYYPFSAVISFMCCSLKDRAIIMLLSANNTEKRLLKTIGEKAVYASN